MNQIIYADIIILVPCLFVSMSKVSDTHIYHRNECYYKNYTLNSQNKYLLKFFENLKYYN